MNWRKMGLHLTRVDKKILHEMKESVILLTAQRMTFYSWILIVKNCEHCQGSAWRCTRWCDSKPSIWRRKHDLGQWHGWLQHRWFWTQFHFSVRRATSKTKLKPKTNVKRPITDDYWYRKPHNNRYHQYTLVQQHVVFQYARWMQWTLLGMNCIETRWHS